MDTRVRRGLGLLVGTFATWIVVVLAALIFNALNVGSQTIEAVFNLGVSAGILLVFAGGLTGLFMIAWGLIWPKS